MFSLTNRGGKTPPIGNRVTGTTSDKSNTALTYDEFSRLSSLQRKHNYMTDGTNNLFFNYDSAGPLSVIYNDTEYYYVLNAQGDVIALVNSSGAEVVSYSYDPWGDILSTGGSMASTLGQINPLRYRGYVYDTETGLYYLQTRYYNPELCRFICADGLVSTGQDILGFNMFAYCLNNPVNRSDPTGALSSTEIAEMIVGIRPNPEGYTMLELVEFARFEQELNIEVQHVGTVESQWITVDYHCGVVVSTEHTVKLTFYAPDSTYRLFANQESSWDDWLSLGASVYNIKANSDFLTIMLLLSQFFTNISNKNKAKEEEKLLALVSYATMKGKGIVKIEHTMKSGQGDPYVETKYVLWDNYFGSHPVARNPYCVGGI